MLKNQFLLLYTRRFLPLFITQFLGAFNDNLFKNALVILITYIVAAKLSIQPQILVTLTGALLIFPMVIFSAQAGSIADKFEKAKLIRIIKFAEIVLMSLAAVGFILQNVYLLMVVLFLVGLQATFFGPIKYSILPQHLHTNELVAGTGLIEMGTFVAILLGNILGVILITLPQGLMAISAGIILVALAGYLASCFIPIAQAPAPDLKLSLNFIKESLNIVKFTQKTPTIFLCILGISWFWLIGFTFLAEFPSYAKNFIGGDEQIFVLFLAIFSIGVGLGSSLCNRLLKGEIEATYVPLAALGITLFTVDLYFATQHEIMTPHMMQLITLEQFFYSANHWRIMIDMLLIAVCGGIYIVPLYAILQYRAKDSHKARVIASNNIMNALFMSVAALATMLMLKLRFTIPQIFLTVGVVNLLVVIKSCQLLPGALLQSILRTLLNFFYRVKVHGLENFHQAGSRVVITPNHTSFLDGLLLAAYLPEKCSFAIYRGYIQKWWMLPVQWFVDVFFVDPTNPFIIKTMVNYVKENKKLVIFPEGRITVTGALMKIYEGPGLIAERADATILPVLIEGAQYTYFSRLRGLVRLRWFPKITLTIYPAEKIKIKQECSGRRRRQLIGQRLYEIMSNILFLGNDTNITLFHALLDAKNIHGYSHKIVEDTRRVPLSYHRLIMASLVIGRKLAKLTKKQEVVGLLLPNMVGTVVAFFGLQAYLRVAAILNFSTGLKNVVNACETTQIKLVCTSRMFVETAKFQDLINVLMEKNIKIVYLEDLKAEVSMGNKIYAFLATHLPKLFGLYYKSSDARKPAVILFTSGSEGNPKAVVLSSKNIQANKAQLSSRFDFSPSDIILNAMPIFHAFGLTAGTILPILYGMKVFFYPSPLHYRVIPELSYDINATILFGTNTFLTGYAKYANPYDFYSLRYVFAGAEKLKEDNRRFWADKFGVRIFEGYGATETSPVISANTPMHYKVGTVGKFMPGIEYRLAAVPDIQVGGLLSVKGPNIMLGYMFHDKPGVIVPPENGWYSTGDIITLDEDGYISIQGRVKRFAKIAGEMVSLAFVEHYMDELWPNTMNAVVALPDEKKGEQLVLVTTQANAQKSEILAYIRKLGISELTVPKILYFLDKMPLLPTGKIDYSAVQRFCLSKSSNIDSATLS